MTGPATTIFARYQIYLLMNLLACYQSLRIPPGSRECQGANPAKKNHQRIAVTARPTMPIICSVENKKAGYLIDFRSR